MKKFALAAIAAMILAAPGYAGTPGSTNNGVNVKKTGQNAFQYNDPVFGEVTCNETSHKKFDTVGCTLSGSSVAPGTTATGGWISDFDGTTYGSITYTVSADGSSYSGIATYN